MEIVALPSRAGKSRKAIEKAVETKGYIVCSTHEEAHRLQREAKAMGLYVNFPLTWNEFLDRRYNHHGVACFIIDNLDALVQRLSPEVPIVMVTVTKDSYYNKQEKA